MKRTIIFILSVCLLAACHRYPAGVRQALALASDNREELESVLEHYSHKEGDSLKYRAACFLIENMPYHHTQEGERLDEYLSVFEEIATSPCEPQEVVDSFIAIHGRLSPDNLVKKPDIQTVGSAYLIHNIEWAFKVREEKPWGKNVSFSDFCEYILPYRVGDERLTEWRQRLYEKYNPVLEPWMESPAMSDPLFAAGIIFDYLSREEKHFTGILSGYPHAGPNICDRWKSGSCRELTDLTVYVMRSLGIPSGTDFFHHHARVNSGHSWAFFFDKSGNTYTSDYLDAKIGILSSFISQHFTPKVYRQTFSLNRNFESQLQALDSVFPPFFVSPLYVDVTTLYTDKNPIRSFHIPDAEWYFSDTGPGILYLCASFHQGWAPVAWVKSDHKQTRFENVKSDVVLRVASWEENQLRFHTDPFKVDRKTGALRFFRKSDREESVCLFSKHEVKETEGFTQFMMGSVIEGSNRSDFDHPDTLFVVDQLPERLINIVPLNPGKTYRYVRYRGCDNSNCDISEIMFFQHPTDSVPLKGKPMGTPNNKGICDRNEYDKALDGDPYTSFSYKYPSGGWVGLDLGKPQTISKIIFIPRNRDNFIRKGDRYELFYYDLEWTSLGIKTACSDSLLYDCVPGNTLLYLKNHSRGIQERIFSYENGKQAWL